LGGTLHSDGRIAQKCGSAARGDTHDDRNTPGVALA
jgi:hypothetical protein